MAAATTDYPFELGSYSRAVTTSSAQAQLWFNRGMVWCMAFHHEEGIWCFEQCLKEDPNCAMAHYGIALAHGPDYNVNIGNYYPVLCATSGYPSMEAATKHTQKAREVATSSGAQPVEVALIEALAGRYAWPLPEGDINEVLRQQSLSFSEAMRDVYARFPDDPDVAVIFAEALMNLTPWKLFHGTTYEPASHVKDIVAALHKALQLTPGHPGANHFMVHLMEMSPSPQDSLSACAVLLQPAAADAPHLLHMPSHIHVLLGRYGDAAASNAAAVEANTKLYTPYGVGDAARTAGTPFYIGYVVHDYHMLVYAAMFAGSEKQALSYARKLVDVCPESTLRLEGMAVPLEMYHTTEIHVLMRFGRWEEILALPFPTDATLWVATTAMLRYARALAFAALGRVGEAEAERGEFLQAASVMEGEQPSVVRVIHNNSVPAVLEVAKRMSEGEILYRKGRLQQESGVDGGADIEAAFNALRAAAELDDGLNYDEPWGWMVPARHALGGLLLEQGRVEEAAAVYRSDMSGFSEAADSSRGAACAGRHNRHPENIWSLRGLTKCFEAGARRVGSDEDETAMAKRLEEASRHADVKVVASCACVRSCGSPEQTSAM